MSQSEINSSSIVRSKKPHSLLIIIVLCLVVGLFCTGKYADVESIVKIFVGLKIVDISLPYFDRENFAQLIIME